MLSVKRLWERKTYPVMTKEQFAESWSRTHQSDVNWNDPSVIHAWRRQILFNRTWVLQVLNDRNWRPLCMGCHDYSHARERLQSELKRLSRDAPDSAERAFVEDKLKTLDKLNTPELIREYGYRRSTTELWGESVKVTPIPPELIERERWDGFEWVPTSKV